MIGLYTEEEIHGLTHRGGIISSAADFIDGKLTRIVNRTITYYRREVDGSWTNYKCRQSSVKV